MIAFGIDFVLQYCQAHPYNPTEEPILCVLDVRTLVNDVYTAANGTDDGEPDAVCIGVTVEDKITRAELTQAGGCTFSFWDTTFVPFYEWMATAHPDSDPDDMYDDRISPEGLQTWAQYTAEYEQEHTP